MTTTLRKGQRVTGTDREKLAKKYAKAYGRGQSIREISEAEGRSYGFVHRVLSECPDVTFASRGGNRRKKK